MIRRPTIIESGRLGLLAILFEFIDDNMTVWLVGNGSNRYQFIYADDLAQARIKAMEPGRTDTFHIGSDHVESLREAFEAEIRATGSKSKVRSLPKGPAIFTMKLAHHLHISSLGPYHYKVIAEDFLFDTTKIKRALDWKPTLRNSEKLVPHTSTIQPTGRRLKSDRTFRLTAKPHSWASSSCLSGSRKPLKQTHRLQVIVLSESRSRELHETRHGDHRRSGSGWADCRNRAAAALEHQTHCARGQP